MSASGRPSWSGYLKFNLLSVPVKGYNAAATGGGKIGFHLLHAKCNQRIHYKKVCPIHGEVANDEIVSGYEVSKGKYVVVDQDERKGAKSEDDKTISVEAFVPPEAIDPVCFTGRSYFLVPDGKVAQQPYAVMLDAMRREGRYAIAMVVFAGRPQLAAVHPIGKILAMMLLSYESERKPSSSFEDELQHAVPAAAERKLAQSLIEAATDEHFDLAKYKDEYSGRLSKLVEHKAKRVRNVVGNKDEAPAVINLMDALRKSLDRTTATKQSHPVKHRGAKKPAARTRKTG